METTMITTMKATQGILINIDNYSFYQDPKNYESNSVSITEAEAAATMEQQEPNNINNNEKNDKKKIKSTTEGIRQMIIFSQNNDFWKGNILSTLKLREKYDQLYVQSRSKRQYQTFDTYN